MTKKPKDTQLREKIDKIIRSETRVDKDGVCNFSKAIDEILDLIHQEREIWEEELVEAIESGEIKTIEDGDIMVPYYELHKWLINKNEKRN